MINFYENNSEKGELKLLYKEVNNLVKNLRLYNQCIDLIKIESLENYYKISFYNKNKKENEFFRITKTNDIDDKIKKHIEDNESKILKLKEVLNILSEYRAFINRVLKI